MLLKNYHSLLIAIARGLNGINIYHLCKLYRSIATKWQTHHGKKCMVMHMKDLNSIAERYSMYQTIEPIKFLKSDVDGFPLEIRSFKSYLRNENPVIVKIALSIFRSCELNRLPPSHDIETVERQPSYNEEVVADIIRYIPNFINKLSKLEYKRLIYHYTVKNGPNGPALSTSDSDLGAVREDIEIYSAIKAVSIELEDKDFPEEDYYCESSGIHSKLSQFSEKSGKTRTIGIVDYYSQRALYPLHQGLMSLLRKIPSDGTFSHRNVGNYALEATKTKSYIATSDMTAFTDLFPAIIQKELLFKLEPNQDLAKAWWTLLSERTFKVAWSGSDVKYGTGQPMGAYASWPLCTLAHHLVMHYSAYKCSIKNVNSLYRILGDDNERTNEVLSIHYEETLRNLGCELNPNKGTCSREGIKYSSAEVAKRLYLNGIDISPLTPGLLKSLTNPALLNNALMEIVQIFDEPSLPVHILENIVSKRHYDKCVMLCTNPFNGAIKPGNPGYESYQHIWEGIIQDDQYGKAMLAYRIKNLIDKATSIDDREDLLFQWVRLKNNPKRKYDSSVGDMELRSAPQYAMHFCKKHLLTLLARVINKLEYKDVKNNELILDEVEYLPDPRNPFLDSKDVRNNQATLLVEKVYTFLQAGGSAADLLEDIDTLPVSLNI